MHLIRAMMIAFSTYSRIPMPQTDWSDENRRYAMCFFPLIGAAVGLATGLVLLLCEVFSAGALLRGALCAAVPLLITGGIHMDGFMDTCDAVSSWQTTERRHEILKDPHTGAFAVMGCCGYLLLYAGAMGEARTAIWPGIAAGCVFSRALSALALTHLKKANPKGMLGSFAGAGHAPAVTAACAAYLAGSAAVLIGLYGAAGAAAAAGQCLCLAAYRRMAYRCFGGVTGDLAGWFLQMAELTSILMLIMGGGR